MATATQRSKDPGTQEFVPIDEVRDGVVILKDKSLCMVLMASSVNFALKSADEQQAIILQFQNFLNSLDFSIQILVQSRRLDIRPYIGTLEDKLKEQANELLRVQTREYIGFIRNFTESVNVMSKTFYIVIPYVPGTVIDVKQGPFGRIFGGSGKKNKEVERIRFEEQRTQLEQRVNVVENGLMRTGVRTATLGTEELVELFFKIFNPGDIVRPKLGN